MAKIKSYSGTCDSCLHSQVCQYSEIRKEVFGKMACKLDNCCCPDIFQFSFECKQYRKNENVKGGLFL